MYIPQVFAIRILAFSIRRGPLAGRLLSRMKPAYISERFLVLCTDSPSSRYESVSLPPTFLMIWICSRSVEPYKTNKSAERF